MPFAASLLLPHLRLWQMISPSLPVGAYAYSSGLEQMIGDGVIGDAAALSAWLRETLAHGPGRADLPILARIRRALGEDRPGEAGHWSAELLALRETNELRLADVGMGRALARLLADLGVPVFARDVPFAAAFAMASAHFDVPARAALAGFAWAWCEAQVAAAVKLVPLGHTDGQRVMLALGAEIVSTVDAALALPDDAIGYAMPGLAIASALHETRYSRLFRS